MLDEEDGIIRHALETSSELVSSPAHEREGGELTLSRSDSTVNYTLLLCLYVCIYHIFLLFFYVIDIVNLHLLPGVLCNKHALMSKSMDKVSLAVDCYQYAEFEY